MAAPSIKYDAPFVSVDDLEYFGPLTGYHACDVTCPVNGGEFVVDAPICTPQTGCASENAPGTPCSGTYGHTTKQTCSLADEKFYLDADIVKQCEAIANTVTYSCDGPGNSRAQCKIGFYRTINSNQGKSDTCNTQATCGDKDQSGMGNNVTDAECGSGYKYNPDAAPLYCLGATCNIRHKDPVDGDKQTCCMILGSIPNELVVVSASLALGGVSKASMQTAAAKDGFADAVAGNVGGVDGSDINITAVREIFTDRRLDEHGLDLDLDLGLEHRQLTATGVEVGFDISIDTNNAQSAGAGDGTSAGLFSAIVSDLSAAVASGSMVATLNNESISETGRAKFHAWPTMRDKHTQLTERTSCLIRVHLFGNYHCLIT